MGGKRIGLGEGFVFLVDGGGVWGRDGIVGLFAGAEVIGVFADDGGVFSPLTGGVLDLDDAGELFVVRIIHLHGGLEEAGGSRIVS